MNITNEEIKVEFKRQVKLCQGIGKAEMLTIINYPSTLLVICNLVCHQRT